ncbi:putative MFS family arabinose efflux permease [Kribbella orskensis]|uniref:MFS family arabinose efflux permease n=1 Tax=Kribbella orskensis TaxID=2512216 RepID=A0ABY2BSS7_9ACTN|nr:MULTISPECIES: MFS transporter [Kribbella]TCN42930.1 putative MFS family arabinose efflux permease [Kribbella sp. VKM Ac-2500]TCO29714.1 putative MFS family arabinose efflux permease [Kribbella orskensis]
MKGPAERVLRTYLVLVVVSTSASSMIWGINTLFLLDAGLSVGEAFAANAFFTAGMVLFEVPTGVVADTVGRRMSYLLGAATLVGATLLYLVLWQTQAPFAAWAGASVLLGLGFTFFSGATEAWLVDGLNATGYEGSLEAAFAKGQVAGGVAMMGGTVAGGVLAQTTNLGVPYVVRAVLLALTFVVAWRAMHDVGFEPKPRVSVTGEMRGILRASMRHGLGNPPVRWLMLAAPFAAGVSGYGFYAAQPYLLELYGSSDSYAVAGLAAALVAGAQIAGGASASLVSRAFRRRTSVLLITSVIIAVSLVLIGLVSNFWAALLLLAIWATMFAAAMPVRQAFLNGLIPSGQRATVLSSDNLLASGGGVVIQPALGKAADVWGFGPAYVVGAGIQLLVLPFILLARRERAITDAPPDAGVRTTADEQVLTPA